MVQPGGYWLGICCGTCLTTGNQGEFDGPSVMVRDPGRGPTHLRLMSWGPVVATVIPAGHSRPAHVGVYRCDLEGTTWSGIGQMARGGSSCHACVHVVSDWESLRPIGYAVTDVRPRALVTALTL